MNSFYAITIGLGAALQLQAATLRGVVFEDLNNNALIAQIGIP